MFADENSGGKFMRNRLLVAIAVTLISATTAWASSESILYNFNSFTGDGYYPYSGLVADAKGNLYGTTQNGGNAYGTVFELKLSGSHYTEVQLHVFNLGTLDGQYPEYSSLVFDKAGNLYGTTQQGGTNNLGTVFELTLSGGKWTEKLLHSFAGTAGKDGQYPQAGLSLDAAGNLYGTTQYGGIGYGTVFQFKPSNGKWTYKKIHTFNAANNGAYYPLGGITPGAHGYYYGTTQNGGSTYNAGMVYRLFLSRGVWVAQKVFAFSGGAGGTYPQSSLTIDPAGNFYGTTYQGGANNLGTVYKLKLGANDKYTQSVIYSFKGGTTDGEYPWYAGVTLDANNNIYGTTRYGGSSNEGIVFELKLASGKYKESILHVFVDASGNDGYDPLAGVILFKGKLYGTTYAGGTKGAGTVFKVTP
jgi:uncharacterized repeat protein (TIGR03803 family)